MMNQRSIRMDPSDQQAELSGSEEKGDPDTDDRKHDSHLAVKENG